MKRIEIRVRINKNRKWLVKRIAVFSFGVAGRRFASYGSNELRGFWSFLKMAEDFHNFGSLSDISHLFVSFCVPTPILLTIPCRRIAGQEWFWQSKDSALSRKSQEKSLKMLPIWHSVLVRCRWGLMINYLQPFGDIINESTFRASLFCNSPPFWWVLFNFHFTKNIFCLYFNK